MGLPLNHPFWNLKRIFHYKPSILGSPICETSIREFPSMGAPNDGWFIMKHPMKIDDLEEPLFQETTKLNALDQIIGWNLVHEFPIKVPCQNSSISEMDRGTPSHHPFEIGIFHSKLSSYWGAPMTMETPKWAVFKTPGGWWLVRGL